MNCKKNRNNEDFEENKKIYEEKISKELSIISDDLKEDSSLSELDEFDVDFYEVIEAYGEEI